jgi:outer membrane protein OmpA-like peptidoglycan-associated protein
VKFLLPGLILLGCCSLLGRPSTATPAQKTRPPAYRMRVMSRPLEVMHYRHHGAPTVVDFVGTALMPKAHGEAKVYRGDQGFVIETEMEHMDPAAQFGTRYMTYVLWALAPDGRAHNLGELRPSKGKAKLETQTDLSDFAMMVTAEPDFAVIQPSPAVVLDNVSHLYATTGRWLEGVVQAPLDPNRPLDLYEARNAVQLADQEGAAQDARELLRKAKALLEQAENQLRHSKDKEHRAAIQTAREATQAAEAARAKTAAYLEQQRQRNAQVAQIEQSAGAKAREEQGAQRDAVSQDQAGDTQARGAVDGTSATRPENDPKRQFRGQLLRQLRTALDTRETPRGLAVQLSGGLFGANQAMLSADAREKLAKISGILLAHPGLSVEVDSYDEKSGSGAGFDGLARKRAIAVRDYLIHQGIPGRSIRTQATEAAAGGETHTDPKVKQSDRRMEMVVSGEPIGI